MQTSEAVSVLKNIAFKPGWSFDAIAVDGLPAGARFLAQAQLGDRLTPSTILFRMETETVDTDREYARNGYDMPKTLEDVVPLDADDFDSADELLFAVFSMLMSMEVHEAREFFRCKDRDWNAPFHPHRPEGKELWEKCNAMDGVLTEDRDPNETN